MSYKRAKRDLENIASWRPYSRRRSKRAIALYVTLGLLVYIFWDSVGLPKISSSLSVHPELQEQHQQQQQQQQQEQNKNGEGGKPPRERHEWELLGAASGKIELPNLYETLVTVSHVGRPNRDRHVLFVASNIASASAMAGVACEMAAQKRNFVHLMITGKTDMKLDFFKNANGISPDRCQIFVHDARPNFATRSNDERIGLSTTAVIKYAMEFISPRAILVAKDGEDAWFSKAMKKIAPRFRVTLVELPDSAAEKIPWITRLDAGALENWHKPKVDIVVQANGRAGSLMRLLKSLKDADYFGSEPPRLRIELHPTLDPNVRKFVRDFRWPSEEGLLIHHRVLPRDDEKTRSRNLIESFYPNDEHHGVLILDPNVEVSKYYYHWFTFATLEYKYAQDKSWEATSVSGISLMQPTAYLNGTIPFAPPSLATGDRKPFLYSAPSQHACLIFGDFWAEFHEYAGRRLRGSENPPSSPSPSSSTKIADYTLPFTWSTSTLPSWYTLFLELITARGYSTLYPGYDSTESLAILHSQKQKSTDKKSNPLQQLMTMMNSIVASFPGRLPSLDSLTILDFNAVKTERANLDILKESYKKKIANCENTAGNDRFHVDDLFCDVEVVMISRGDADEVEKDEERRAAQEVERQGRRGGGAGGGVEENSKWDQTVVEGAAQEEFERPALARAPPLHEKVVEELPRHVT